MYSALVPFENIVDAVKDATGIQNLRNLYPQLRRFVYRAEREIGFGSGVIMKKIVYKTSNNTIVNNRLKLPDDMLYLESFGMCQEGICPKDYKIQGNWVFLCRPIESFTLIYYSLLCDGEGNPSISENHFEAVVAGILFFMYQPKRWNREGDRGTLKDLEVYYEDRIGEARGDDVFPSTKEEWSQIAQQLQMSRRDTLIYSDEKKCFCCIDESENPQELIETGTTSQEVIYYWQYSNLADDISLAPDITQTFLESKNIGTLSEFLSGNIISYTAIGRIGFAIQNIEENKYKIVDLFNSDITNIVFDSYYNIDLKTQIFISKEYYSHGNIYFKIIEN